MDRPYLRASDLAKRYGFTSRYWIRQAAEGKLPGAMQPSGAKGHWLFERTAIERWWKSRQRGMEQWQMSTRGGKRGGADSRDTVSHTTGLSKQKIDELLKSACKTG